MQYQVEATADVPADVVPLKPTWSGNFPKANNAPGSFPDFGAGLWMIDGGPSMPNLDLGGVEIAPGLTIDLRQSKSATFIAAQTPTYGAVINLRTIYLHFYSMGGWGR